MVLIRCEFARRINCQHIHFFVAGGAVEAEAIVLFVGCQPLL